MIQIRQTAPVLSAETPNSMRWSASLIPTKGPRTQVGILLTIILCLIIWGPPRLRFDARPMDISLNDPFNLDLPALFQLGALACGASTCLVLGLTLSAAGLGVIKQLMRGPLRWYLVLVFLGIASAAYSVRPLYTLHFGIKLAVTVCLPLLVVARNGRFNICHPLWCLGIIKGVQATVILGASFFVPQLVGETLPGGSYRITGGPFNDFGSSAAIALIGMTIILTERLSLKLRITLWLLAASMLMQLYLVRGRGAWIEVVVGCVAAFGIKFPRRLVPVMSVALLLSVALVTANDYQEILNYLRRGQSDVELYSASGRVQAFDYLAGISAEQPVLGFGYAAGSRLAMISFAAHTGLGMGAAHDIVSRSLADLGYVGLSIVVMIYLSAGVLIFKVARARMRLSQFGSSAAAISTGILLMELLSGANGGGILEASTVVPICLLVLRAALSSDFPLQNGGFTGQLYSYSAENSFGGS